MALDAAPTLSTDLQSRLDDYFAALGQGVNAQMTRQARLSKLAHLDAMTDTQLAELGVTRAEIPSYVFSDMFPF